MAEEKKEETNKEEVKPQEAVKGSAAAAAMKKKIAKLSIQEVEEKLKDVEAKMGGLNSKYAQHLMDRKNNIMNKS